MTACRSHKMRSVSISCSHSCTDHGTRKCYALVQKGSTWYRKSRTIAFNSIIIAASPEHIEFAYQRSARPDRWSLKRSAISGSSLHHVHNRLYCDKQGQSQHYSTLFSLSPLLLFIFFLLYFSLFAPSPRNFCLTGISRNMLPPAPGPKAYGTPCSIRCRQTTGLGPRSPSVWSTVSQSFTATLHHWFCKEQSPGKSL